VEVAGGTGLMMVICYRRISTLFALLVRSDEAFSLLPRGPDSRVCFSMLLEGSAGVIVLEAWADLSNVYLNPINILFLKATSEVGEIGFPVVPALKQQNAPNKKNGILFDPPEDISQDSIGDCPFKQVAVNGDSYPSVGCISSCENVENLNYNHCLPVVVGDFVEFSPKAIPS
jgi:hypothetical protein